MKYHELKGNKCVKLILMIIGIGLMLYAFNSAAVYYPNGSNNYDRAVSLFCTIWTGLVLAEYWPYLVLRAVSGMAFLGSVNMALDEFVFRPDIVQQNEYVSFIIIITITCYNVAKALYGSDPEAQP